MNFPILKLDADKKRLLENFAFLSLLQGVNYVLPLTILPYLVRTLGPEEFGLISFAQVFTQYFNILTDYGFNLSATREISIHRENKDKISEIFSSVIIIKFALLILSFVIMSVVVFSFERFKRNWLVYYLTFGTVVGQVLLPVWFFQGMEKMRYITFLNITAKLIFTVSIFAFVHRASDYLYVPLINSLSSCIVGVLSLRIVFKNFGLSFKIPKMIAIKHQLTEGWYTFISSIAISLYTISNTFILGLLTNDTIVGYYSAAEKIVRAVQGFLNPISQTIYPYISKLVKESEKKGIQFIQKVTFLIGSVSFILSVGIFISASLIVKFLLGDQYTRSIVVLKILSFLPFIIALSNVFGIQTMLNFNHKEAFSKILISASVINILLSLIFVPFYQHIGTSFATIASELFVTISMFIYLQKKGIRVLEGKVV